MADALTIQRYPRGLLDALAMKGTGQTPQVCAPDLRIGFDATALYLQETRRTASGVTTALVSGYLPMITVPAGEGWLVNNITARVTTTATDSCEANIAYRTLGGLTFFIAQWYEIFAISQDRFTGGQFNPYELVLGPGMTIGMVSTAVVGAPDCTLQTDYFRLAI